MWKRKCLLRHRNVSVSIAKAWAFLPVFLCVGLCISHAIKSTWVYFIDSLYELNRKVKWLSPLNWLLVCLQKGSCYTLNFCLEEIHICNMQRAKASNPHWSFQLSCQSNPRLKHGYKLLSLFFCVWLPGIQYPYATQLEIRNKKNICIIN